MKINNLICINPKRNLMHQSLEFGGFSKLTSKDYDVTIPLIAIFAGTDDLYIAPTTYLPQHMVEIGHSLRFNIRPKMFNVWNACIPGTRITRKEYSFFGEKVIPQANNTLLFLHTDTLQ